MSGRIGDELARTAEQQREQRGGERVDHFVFIVSSFLSAGVGGGFVAAGLCADDAHFEEQSFRFDSLLQRGDLVGRES